MNGMLIKIAVIVVTLLSLSACAQKKTMTDSGEVGRQKNNKVAAKYNVKLGLAYLQQGDVYRSKRKLLTALHQDPKSPTVNDALGYYMELTGSLKSAENYYKHAMILAPGKGAQLNNYGTYLCRQKRYNESIGYFVRATQDPNFIDSAGAFENAGLCSMAIPDVATAKKYFDRALKQDPRRQTSLIEMAQIGVKQKHYKYANRFLKAYEKVGPTTAESSYLGYQIANATHQVPQTFKYENTLRSQFADSSQYKQLQTSAIG